MQGKQIVIIGRNNEAADYALAMLLFTSSVMICTNAHTPQWDADHAGWLAEYVVPIRHDRIGSVRHENGQLRALIFEQGGSVNVEGAFTTRGDVVS